MDDRTQPLKKRIAQLEAEVRALRKQAQAQRQRITQECGHEFLALVDSDRNCKVFVTDIVQKIVFEDEEGKYRFPNQCFFCGQDYSGKV